MRRLGGGLALALLAFGGCAQPASTPPPPSAPAVAAAASTRDDLYVLVPDADGKTGALSVIQGAAQQVLATPYASARIRQDGQIEGGAVSQELVKQIFADALAAQPARPVSFLLYFLEGRDDLTPQSQQVIQQVFAEIARRPSPEIVVIGHSDRVGTVASNDALSLRRAQKVRDDLVRRGIAPERIETAGRGEREPLVPTAPQVPEPRNRRVEISIR
jgi:outer membrane protein OmpA-like peptidoglycan-associated protein